MLKLSNFPNTKVEFDETHNEEVEGFRVIGTEVE
jgi:hypothetical protein